MPNPDLIPVPFAQDGQKNTIQLDRVVSDPVYRATWAEGFPADTRIPKEVGGEGPDGLDFNGILNALSQAVVFLQKGNAYQFDASLAPYPIGALVRSSDNLTTYQSTIAGNSNDPNSNMTGWRVYNGQGFIADNLTTDDSTRALSAAQGKILQDTKIAVSSRGSANGVASLDANSRVPVAQLPEASTTQKGVVRAATATEVTNKSNVNAYVTPSNAALIAQSTDLGVGQSWQDVTSQRVYGTTYTNNTSKPIQVMINLNFGQSGTLTLNGIDFPIADGDTYSFFNFIVPVGNTYKVSYSGIITWAELR